VKKTKGKKKTAKGTCSKKKKQKGEKKKKGRAIKGASGGDKQGAEPKK